MKRTEIRLTKIIDMPAPKRQKVFNVESSDDDFSEDDNKNLVREEPDLSIFGSLPPEVWLKIFEKLDLDTLKRWREVCKKWNNLISIVFKKYTIVRVGTDSNVNRPDDVSLINFLKTVGGRANVRKDGIIDFAHPFNQFQVVIPKASLKPSPHMTRLQTLLDIKFVHISRLHLVELSFKALETVQEDKLSVLAPSSTSLCEVENLRIDQFTFKKFEEYQSFANFLKKQSRLKQCVIGVNCHLPRTAFFSQVPCFTKAFTDLTTVKFLKVRFAFPGNIYGGKFRRELQKKITVMRNSIKEVIPNVKFWCGITDEYVHHNDTNVSDWNNRANNSGSSDLSDDSDCESCYGDANSSDFDSPEYEPIKYGDGYPTNRNVIDGLGHGDRYYYSSNL